MSDNSLTIHDYSKMFTNSVEKSIKEFNNKIEVSQYQKKLIYASFQVITDALRKESLQWKDVRLDLLARQLANKSLLGLDVSLGHFYPIIYKEKNGTSVNLQLGYKGRIHIAKSFSENPPKDIRGEIIYSNDEFTLYKRGKSCASDSYDLKIKNPLQRGNILGAVGIAIYDDESLNKIVVMTKEEIDKIHKPTIFWKNWEKQMIEKTVINLVCNSIPVSSKKIIAYKEIMEREQNFTMEFEKEVGQIEALNKLDNMEKLSIDNTGE